MHQSTKHFLRIKLEHLTTGLDDEKHRLADNHLAYKHSLTTVEMMESQIKELKIDLDEPDQVTLENVRKPYERGL